MFSAIYPNFNESEIQLFSDKWGKEAEHFPVWARSEEYIKEKNSKWMWVFFTINQMKKWMCSKDWVIWVNAWAVDIDDKDWLEKKDQLDILTESPITPSLIVESKWGYHAYWFANNWTIENWHVIQKIICDYFNGDRKIVTDTSRVLRLPWYYHHKWDPFMVTYLSIWDFRYTEQEMIEWFKDKFSFKAELAKKVNKKFKPWSLEHLFKKPEKREYTWNEESCFEKARNSDQMTLLSKLSGSRYVNWETYDFVKNWNWTYQIIINWKSSWNWIDNNYTIWSKAKDWKDGWPTIIEWLRYYWHSNKDIYSILKTCI